LALKILDGVKNTRVLRKKMGAATGASMASSTLGVADPFNPIDNSRQLAKICVVDLLEAE
jgi:hypothetical protein